MILFTSILLFGLLTGTITYFGYRQFARPARFYARLGTAKVDDSFEDEVSPKSKLSLRSILEYLGSHMPTFSDDTGFTRRALIAGGFRSDAAVYVFNGVRIVLCIALFFIMLGMCWKITDNPVLRVVIVIGAGFIGYCGPGFYLDRIVDSRHERLRNALPDALDVMVIAVEAGMGLDQAIQQVGKQLKNAHKELCEELAILTAETRAGSSRAEALRNLAERTDEPDTRKLVAVLIQSDRFGTSIADSLRTHSDFMRVRRRQAAEERASKVGVKLVFPIFFCILPSMILVAAGPGLLQVFKYLFPMMRQF